MIEKTCIWKCDSCQDWDTCDYRKIINGLVEVSLSTISRQLKTIQSSADIKFVLSLALEECSIYHEEG